MRERGQTLYTKWLRFSHPIAITIDCTRFDAHVDMRVLQIEHSIYTHMCNDPYLAKLLTWQLYNKGSSKEGVKYSVVGRRMSGDMNTALGNCLLMILMVMTAFDGFVGRWDMFDDGDDCLVIVEQSHRTDAINRILGVFPEFGHVVKIEKIAETFEHIEFCQSHPVHVNGKPTFIRNVDKILSTSLTGSKFNQDGKRRRDLVRTIGQCELALSRGVPVLQAYCECLLRSASAGKLLDPTQLGESSYRIRRELKTLNLTLQEVTSEPITDATRLSFAQAFGIGIDEQIDIESKLNSTTIDILGKGEPASQIVLPRWETAAQFECNAITLREL
jgi:hypothetical protein